MTTWKLVSVDTGGTFTDLIGLADGRVKVIKEPSTPDHPEKAIMRGMEKLGASTEELIHGTTVAINALLQRNGAKVGLITTKGFADVIEIGRQARRDIYELVPSRVEPLVDQMNRFEVDERILHDGTILRKLDTTSIFNKIKNSEIESLAVCLLFSFANPIHEEQLILELKKLGIPISASYLINPEYREYERTSTTVMDAYIKPLVQDYIHNLKNTLDSRNVTDHLAIMKSSKGLSTPEGLLRKPVEILVSGLAGGIQAGELTSRLLNIDNIITLDIGGTSTDVSQVTGGKVSTLHNLKVNGLPISIPSVDVRTIGAGGGSIAEYIGGILRVGPRSAGASPGPACYGIGGTEVTITDADFFLGILPDTLGGDVITLRRELAEKTLLELADNLGVGIDRTVEGIRTVFHENIAGALRNVTTERGVDPRSYALLAFGGAGPVHGCQLAELMGMSHVIIPPYPGIWSAFGLLGADYRYDVSRGRIIDLDQSSSEEIETELIKLHQTIEKMAAEDKTDQIGSNEFTDHVAMRFKGQSYELDISWNHSLEELRMSFLKKHEQEYGFAATDELIEMVSIRSSGVINHPDPVLPEIAELPTPLSTTRIVNHKEIPVYSRKDLGRGISFTGPLLVDQLDSTTYIPEGWKATIDHLGFIHARRNEID